MQRSRAPLDFRPLHNVVPPEMRQSDYDGDTPTLRADEFLFLEFKDFVVTRVSQQNVMSCHNVTIGFNRGEPGRRLSSSSFMQQTR